jgi:hypothetical protein
MSDVPDAIAAAAAVRQDQRQAHLPGLVFPGEFVTINSEDKTVRAVALIMAVRDDYVEIRLCSNETEQATSIDIVVPASPPVRPYRLLVQGELFGPVWRSQVGDHKGVALGYELERVRNLLADNGIEGDGLVLAGPRDGRWQFKQRELQRLLRFVAPCRAELLERVL